MVGWRLNLLLLLLGGTFAFLQYRLWFEADGVNDLRHLKKTLAVQEAENANLKKRNDELLFQITRLKNSQDAAEGRARNELGMIKKDETFYQVVQ